MSPSFYHLWSLWLKLYLEESKRFLFTTQSQLMTIVCPGSPYEGVSTAHLTHSPSHVDKTQADTKGTRHV